MAGSCLVRVQPPISIELDNNEIFLSQCFEQTLPSKQSGGSALYTHWLSYCVDANVQQFQRAFAQTDFGSRRGWLIIRYAAAY